MTERCEACNHETDTPHAISVIVAADVESGTEMTAYFCPDHCPGGCDVERTHLAAHGKEYVLDQEIVDKIKRGGPPHGLTQVAR